MILDGKKIEADAAYSRIYKSAKHTVYIIDNYVGLKTFELLRSVNPKVSIIVFSDNRNNRDSLTASMVSDFKSDYPNPNISFKITNNAFHDRYIFVDYSTVDEAIYHCGSSSKDAGKRITTILKIEDNLVYHPVIKQLPQGPQLIF